MGETRNTQTNRSRNGQKEVQKKAHASRQKELVQSTKASIRLFRQDQADHLNAQISKLELTAKRREYGAVWQIIGHISNEPNKPIKVHKLDGSLPENDEQL